MGKVVLTMYPLMCVAAAITQLCYSTTSECILKVMPDDEIKVGNGFKYSFPPNATEVEVYHWKTLIAYSWANNSKYTSVVISMNMSTLITSVCLNLTVTFFYRNGAFLMKDCVEYRVTENRPEASQPSVIRLGLSVAKIIGISVGIVIFGTMIAVILWWRFCFSQGTQKAGCERTEAGGHGRGDVERQQPSSPHGDAHSSDPETDGGTAVTPPPIQPSNSESSVIVSITDRIAAWNHRAVHRNTRDNPGGLEDNRGGVIVPNREANDRSRVDQMEEENLLLSDQRNPDRGLDVGDKATVLVNKRDFDPDQVSQGSIDVESTVEGETVI